MEREQAFAELEAAKTFADAHHGCCLTCDNVQAHGWQRSETSEILRPLNLPCSFSRSARMHMESV